MAKKLTKREKRLNRCLRYKKGKCVSKYTQKSKKTKQNQKGAMPKKSTNTT